MFYCQTLVQTDKKIKNYPFNIWRNSSSLEGKKFWRIQRSFKLLYHWIYWSLDTSHDLYVQLIENEDNKVRTYTFCLGYSDLFI